MPRITITGRAIRSAVFRPPVEADWRYLNFFTDSDDLALNRIRGQAQSRVIGTPVMGDGFVQLTEFTNYIQTAIAAPAALTLVAVARGRDWVSGQTQTFISNWNSGANPDPAGCTLGVTNGNLRAFAPTNPAGSAVSLIADAASAIETAWATAAMTLSESGGSSDIAAHDLTAGTKATGAQAYPLRTTTRTFRIGSHYNSVGADKQDLFAAGIISGVVADDALAAIRAWLADLASDFSIAA